MNCQKCGAALVGTEQACPKCGQRIAADRNDPAAAQAGAGGQKAAPPPASNTGGDAGIALAEEPASRLRAAATAADASSEKVLCARCMDSFPEVSIYELGGNRYCEKCFQIVVGDKQPQGDMRVEVAPSARYIPKLDAILWSAFRITCALLIMGFIVAVVLLIRPRSRWSLVKEYDATPAFRPAVAPEGGAPGATPAPAKRDTGGVPAIKSSVVTLPITKGNTQLVCPVCELRLFRGETEASLTCANCSTRISFREFQLLPSLHYVGRDQRGAVLRLGDQERCVEIGQEVSPQNRIFLDRFLADGIVCAKTERITFVNDRMNPPQTVQKVVRLEEIVLKYRADQTTPLSVVQGAHSITCDGRGTKDLYHSNPIEIKIDSRETRTFDVPCPMVACWKQFRVTVRVAPAISVSVAPDMDQVPCPACGFIRHLTPVESGATFACLNCKRMIRLTVVPLNDAKFLGAEGQAARIEHGGTTRLVSPGKDIWPGAGIMFAGFLEDGRAICTRPQSVRFTDYNTVPAAERTASVLMTWTLSKTAGTP